MATKTEIQTKINTIDDGGNNTAAEVRSVLGTDPASLLEAIYGSRFSDNSLTETYTSKNANFDYDINFFKVGSNLIMNGSFTALATVTDEAIFTITDANYKTEIGKRFLSVASSNSNTLTIRTDALNETIVVDGSVFAGESYDFSINYKLLN